MVRFSEKETMRIVELYRQHECLWNTTDLNFRNRPVRNACYERIAREMNIEGFTAADAKTKIRCLRGTHNIEVIKIKRQIEAGNVYYKTNLKWFSIMDSFISNRHSPSQKSSLENGEDTPEGIFPDKSQWDQHSQSNSEVTSVNVSSAPSMPSESEIEQSIQSITEPEVITVTPEIQSVRSISNPEECTVMPEAQGTQPISHSQVVTVTPEILTIKAVSEQGVFPLTSEIKTVKSVSNPETTTATSIIPNTGTSASTPKLYALIPEIQTSKSIISNPKFVTVSAGNNQNVRYVPGSSVFAVSPEIQQRVQKPPADTTPKPSKRRLEEIGSNDPNTEVVNNTRIQLSEPCDRNEDEMDAFGRLVALNLRKMSMKSSLSAQSEILSVLTRFRLKDSAENPPPKQTYPYIVTNGSSPTQNPVVLQKLYLRS